MGAVALAVSWNRWCDPIIDNGRDLYIPAQLLRGAVLYRDILYNYPPLAPYLLAAIVFFTGASLAAYAAIGIACAAAAAALLYAAAYRLAGREAALAAALTFVLVNVCGASSWGMNWISPYTFSATFGMTFLLAFVAAAVFEQPALAVAFAVLASWCKVEYAIAAAAGIVAMVIARKLRARHAVAAAALLALTTAAAAAYFGAANLQGNIFSPALLHGARASSFYAHVSGGAFWQEQLRNAIVCGLLLIPVAWLIRRGQRGLAGAVAVVAAVALPFAIAFFRLAGYLQWLALTRRRDAWLFVLGALSIAASLRVRYNVIPSWYGTFLIVPLYLLIVYAGRNEPVVLALLVALSVRLFFEDAAKWRAKEYPIVTTRGVVLDWNSDRAAVLNVLLPMLHGSVAVMPEGVTLNYFAAVPTTLRYHTFTPVEIGEAPVETEVIRDFEAHPPEQVVIVSRNVAEYGSRGFGLDYGQRLLGLIRSRYMLQARWVRPRFTAILLRRK